MTFTLPTIQELADAADIVHAVVPPTPQYAWPLLRERIGAEVWIKHENHTPTGAFKVRGGLTYFAKIREIDPQCKGVITATRGNHGQSVGIAARRHGLPATIVVPRGNSTEKNAAMRALGVDLIEHGDDFQEARELATELAAKRSLHAIPSFHRNLIAGVATYSVEFLRAVPDLDIVYVPVGLGSGICGMIAARAALRHPVEIVGVVADAAPAYALSFAAKRPIEHAVTTLIADGLACRATDPDALDMILSHVSRIVRVTDDEIVSAMRMLYTDTHNLAEGAGAAGFAAMVQERSRLDGKRVGTVMTGGNVDLALFARTVASP
jgi:threonine dehydratase